MLYLEWIIFFLFLEIFLVLEVLFELIIFNFKVFVILYFLIVVFFDSLLGLVLSNFFVIVNFRISLCSFFILYSFSLLEFFCFDVDLILIVDV